MRSLMFLGGGLLIGVGVAWGEATRSAEQRANERIAEEVAMHKRVLEKAAEQYLYNKSEAPAETEDELDEFGRRDGDEKLMSVSMNRPDGLDEADTSEDAIKVGGEMTVETPVQEISPEYLATAHDYSDMPLSQAGPELEYITEDEFAEEDGRDKEQILIHMGETEPLFITAGVVVPDWSEKISPNILVDMYQKCPPGTDKVLYVRNHRTDTDYEVVQEIP